MAKKIKRVVNYDKPFNLDISVVIFAIITLYLFVNIYIYATRDKITYYEVVTGESAKASNKSYTGLAIRDEHVFFADNAGYIDYFARDNSRVSRNTVLYSLDETGTVTKALSEAAANEESDLNQENLNTIKDMVSSFTSSFAENNFEEVYNFKSSMEGTVLQLLNNNTLEKITKEKGDSFFKIYKPEKAGIVTYYIDDFQEFDESKLNETYFDEKSHPKAIFESGDLIESGSPIYSIVSDEEWNMYIELSEEDAKTFADKSSLYIKFLKDDIVANSNFEIITGADKKKYGKFTLYKYMIRYSSDRYIDFQILGGQISGLKIPKTSIVNKDFYVVPVEYGSYGLDKSNVITFWTLKATEESATPTLTPITPTIFYQDDEYYYLDPKEFEGNEVLQKDDSDNTYKLGKKVSLSGVYNINNGYTTFVQVKVLSETNEYYIVESQSRYGLEVYDHIVLDGSKAKENEVVFQ